MKDLVDDLRLTLASESIRLLTITDDTAAVRPSPGKWSPKEDVVAWKTVPKSEPVTLEYFIRDYVAHMKHHLGQIP